MELFIEVVGWIAALLILAAYGLLSAGKMTGNSVVYQLMNVFGAIGFVINTAYHGAIPSAVLNVVWVGIGLVSLVRIRAAKKANP